MKKILIQILLSLALVSCQVQTTTEENESSKTSLDIEISGKNSSSEIDAIKFLKERASINYNPVSKKYISDTISMKDVRFIIYGTLDSFKLRSKNSFTLIDSIKTIEPFISIISHNGIGGWLSEVNEYSFDRMVRINDINRDGRNDIEVYNDLKSGNGGNATYEVFLNIIDSFQYSQDFSQANLSYDEQTQKYTSKYIGGHAGKIYGLTIYKYDKKSLIPIKTERQEYDQEKEVYINTATDLTSNEVTIKEIEYKK